jgi:hypothetical protein
MGPAVPTSLLPVAQSISSPRRLQKSRLALIRYDKPEIMEGTPFALWPLSHFVNCLGLAIIYAL